MPALDDAALLLAVDALSATDPDLAAIVARHGAPPLWGREPGFETLVQIILEQQVSLGSALAAVGRLRSALGIDASAPLTPQAVLELGEEAMRGAGLTRQKAGYLVGLASDLTSARLDLAAVAAAPDDDARTVLMTVAGIGRWTADIYLLMALGRPDIWPDGDLALAAATRRAKGLAALPTRDEQRAIAAAWRPWRAVAARILWHAYLAGER
ncbi:MAG TPA: DNA-3-methyladenine glycosylase 2 family protein [Candidatus Dormibacteraeota bacterium]|nr:DNA-3-methyladenine glycosylase 2 family protein [Candidatus Dormibacteraeota bacterium]